MIVTVAIPCYRSTDTIETVVESVKQAILNREGNDYQFVLVNDCSPDDTFEAIRRLAEKDEKITGVSLSRNCGQEAATLAALPYVRGDVVVFMDDDGQHPADEIYSLIDKLGEGYDLVYGRFNLKHHNAYKRMVSRIHGFISELNGTKVKGVTLSSYFALSAFAAKQLVNYRSPFVSRGGYLMSVTTKVTNVDITKHLDRIAGSSGYTLSKMLSMFLSSFTNFTMKPIRVSTTIGAVIAITGFLYGLFLIIQKIFRPDVQVGFTSIMAVMLFLGGMIILVLGLLGEYIGRTYMTVSSMPQYIVREELNHEHKE
ncbi:MAG: glycosyltransferase family 2 protein [Oscillospiraceae bacterium]|nr:glycosyltransferase family 2 protein [Oscillospiraceae bacterium]